ncbi:JAB domain-containing protein [Paenibacillus durus]|uniref:DNA repair protein n=1 Tax=Paenibacillus durus TaxID=44251 RepID=A0A089HP91_PAEDU|nr:JAB domain-containing protein [Paenibacillus durus]AIQ13821.1 DNA repair protein [Paenibacillus durus]
MDPAPLDKKSIAAYIQSLHQLTGIPLGKLQRYRTVGKLINALEHPYALELTQKQLLKVEQLNAFLQSHRVLQWGEENAKMKITSPDLAGSYFSAFLSGLRDRERFMVAFLDNSHQIIETRIISEGGIAEAPIYPRNVLKAALNCDCSSVILAHNHPSGSLKPSLEDIALTERMVAIFEPLKIDVLDHIIIGGTGYASMAQLGQVPKAAEKEATYEMITLKNQEEPEAYLPVLLCESVLDEAVMEEEWER